MLTDFLNFNNKATTSTPINTLSPGYVTSLLDIVSQQQFRTQSISQNRIYDYSQAEIDPNYQRSNVTNANTLNTLMSKMSLAVQSFTMMENIRRMTTQNEFNPNNIFSLLAMMNTMSAMPLGAGENPNLSNMTPMISNALNADMTGQFGNGSLSFMGLVGITQTLLNHRPNNVLNLQNLAISSLLPLALGNILPTSLTTVLSSIAFTSVLDDVYDDDQSKTAFTNSMNASLIAFGAASLSSMVHSGYADVIVDMNDPLGLGAQSRIIEELNTVYTQNLEQFVSQADPSLSTTQIASIMAPLTNDAQNNIQAGFNNNLTLPSLNQCVVNVTNDVKLKTYNALVAGTELFFSSIVGQLGVKPSTALANDGTTLSSMDYLLNIQRNIKYRETLLIQGATAGNLRDTQNYFASIMDVTDSGDIDTLSKNFIELLGAGE